MLPDEGSIYPPPVFAQGYYEITIIHRKKISLRILSYIVV